MQILTVLKNKTVFNLGLISLFADISSELLYPITPLFLTSILGASMTSLGIIEGIAEAIAGLLKAQAGHWSDKIRKRKIFVVWGYALGALAKPGIALSTTWIHVLIARGIDRLGKGIRTAPRDALLDDACTRDIRGIAFGWQRAMDSVGATIGPLLAILFLSWNVSLKSIYFFALIPGAITVLLALRVKETFLERTENFESPKIEIWKNKPYLLFLLAWSVFSFGNTSDAFILLKVTHEGFSNTTMILLYCLFNFVNALVSPYFGKLSDRIGRKQILVYGILLFAFVYLGYGYANHIVEFVVLFCLYGIFKAATDGLSKAFCLDLTHPTEKATSMGYLGFATGIATIFGNFMAGFLWDKTSAEIPFLMGAICAFLATLMLSQIKQKASE